MEIGNTIKTIYGEALIINIRNKEYLVKLKEPYIKNGCTYEWFLLNDYLLEE